jgi:hypothetical protein
MVSNYQANKKLGIDKTLTMRKSGQGEKVYSHVGGKTHALEHKAISKETALKQIRDVTEVELSERKRHHKNIGKRQFRRNKYK